MQALGSINLNMSNKYYTAPEAQYDDHLINIEVPQDPVEEAFELVEEDISDHLADVSNPHGVPVEDTLINPRLTINQRGFSGTWSSISDGVYGWDRWRKDGTDMVQPVREQNYESDATYYLYGTGVTDTELTAPSSGAWEISVPQTATEVHLVLGDKEVPVRRRLYEEELDLCMAYYRVFSGTDMWAMNGTASVGDVVCIVLPISPKMIQNPSSVIVTSSYSVTGKITERLSTGGTNPAYDVTPSAFVVKSDIAVLRHATINAGTVGFTFATLKIDSEIY